MQGNACQGPRDLHLRRNLAWDGSGRFRLEAELQTSAKEDPTTLRLVLHQIRLPSWSQKRCTVLTTAVKSELASALSSPQAESTLLQKAKDGLRSLPCSQLLKIPRRSTKAKTKAPTSQPHPTTRPEASTSQLHPTTRPEASTSQPHPTTKLDAPGSTSQESEEELQGVWTWEQGLRGEQALRTLRWPLALQETEGVWVGFEKKSGDERDRLVLGLGGNKERWPITSELPMVKAGRVLTVGCGPRWCLVEIDYQADGPTSERITHQITFQKNKALAALIHQRGYALHDAKRYAESLASFSQAEALDPTLYDATYNKACALALQKRYPEALVALQGLIAKSPKHRGFLCKDSDFVWMRKEEPYRGWFGCKDGAGPSSKGASDEKDGKGGAKKAEVPNAVR